MYLEAYLRRAEKDNSDIRLIYNLMRGNHDFPTQTTKRSIEVFIERHQFSEHVKIAFLNVWNQFEGSNYATIISGRKKIA